MAMSEGKVIRWFENRGFGFIHGRAIHQDVFVHRRDVTHEHRMKMHEGLTVAYRLEQDEKGPVARDVKIVLLS